MKEKKLTLAIADAGCPQSDCLAPTRIRQRYLERRVIWVIKI
jgi:hypothetical protein